MPEEKFAPPPTNIVIRTMEKDIQALQQGGGELPAPVIPEEPAPPPVEDAFLQQQAPTEAMPQGPPGPPPPPPISVDLAAPPAAPVPEVPGEKKPFFSKPIVLALGGIGGLLALGAVGYFVVFPIVQNAFSPVPLPPAPVTSPEESPSPIVSPLPSPSPIAPAITLEKPALQTIDLELAAKTSSDLFAAIATQTAQPAASGTFNILNVKTADAYLTASEVLPLLFDNAPMALISALENSYSLFLYWVNPQQVHLGAYFSLNPIAAEAASAAIREWESSLAADASRFFLGQLAGAMQGTFRDGAYQNVPLRFVPFDSGLAIDYAVIDNTFVFTTGRDAMFEAIRRLTGVE